MMEGAALLSLGQPLVERVFSWNFPINMLRAVACCQQLHTALGEKLKASTHFAREDWVILGEIDKPGFTRRVGQIIKLKPGDRTRYAVQVEGLSWQEIVDWVEGTPFRQRIWAEMDMRLEESGISLPPPRCHDTGPRPVLLSRFKLHKIPATVGAVRLHTKGEMKRSLVPSDSVTLTCKQFDKTFQVSAARIPSQLSIFPNPHGQSPTMEALGRPIVLRQVISAHAFKPLSENMECHAFYMLRIDRWVQNYIHHTDDVRLANAGPTIIAWQDQSDFTLDDMKQAWEFQQAARFVELEQDTPGRLDRLPTPRSLHW